jgi:hypothetical protein
VRGDEATDDEAKRSWATDDERRLPLIIRSRLKAHLKTM